jgi:hypothetical protein
MRPSILELIDEAVEVTGKPRASIFREGAVHYAAALINTAGNKRYSMKPSAELCADALVKLKKDELEEVRKFFKLGGIEFWKIVEDCLDTDHEELEIKYVDPEEKLKSL